MLFHIATEQIQNILVSASREIQSIADSALTRVEAVEVKGKLIRRTSKFCCNHCDAYYVITTASGSAQESNSGKKN